MPHLTHETLGHGGSAPDEPGARARAATQTSGIRGFSGQWAVAGAGCCVAGGREALAGARASKAGLLVKRDRRPGGQ